MVSGRGKGLENGRSVVTVNFCSVLSKKIVTFEFYYAKCTFFRLSRESEALKMAYEREARLV